MSIKRSMWEINTEINRLLKYLNEECEAKMGMDFEADLDNQILYWSFLSTKDNEETFYLDFCNKFPKAKEFNVFTLAVLHEIGHFETEDEMIDDTEIRNTNLTNKEYYNLFNEKIATEWAGNFITEHPLYTTYFNDKITAILKNFYETNLDS